MSQSADCSRGSSRWYGTNWHGLARLKRRSSNEERYRDELERIGEYGESGLGATSVKGASEDYGSRQEETNDDDDDELSGHGRLS